MVARKGEICITKIGVAKLRLSEKFLKKDSGICKLEKTGEIIFYATIKDSRIKFIEVC